MPLHTRRQFLVAGAAATALAPLTRAQFRYGLTTLEDVRWAIAGSGKDIDNAVRAVIRVRREDSQEALKLFKEFIEDRKSHMDPKVLTDGLVQAVTPSGHLHYSGDDMPAPYDNQPMQAEVAKILILAGADAKYRLEDANITGYTAAGGYDPDVYYDRYIDNYTLVHEAVGNLPLVKVLVEDGGADASAVAVYKYRQEDHKKGKFIIGDEEGAVDAAVLKKYNREGLAETLGYLTAHGAKPAEKRLCPVVIYAALRGDAGVLQAMRTSGIPLDVKDADKHTAADYLSGRANPTHRYSDSYHSRDFFKLTAKQKADILKILEQPNIPPRAFIPMPEAIAFRL